MPQHQLRQRSHPFLRRAVDVEPFAHVHLGTRMNSGTVVRPERRVNAAPLLRPMFIAALPRAVNLTLSATNREGPLRR
jgi:hypothetical protein